MKPKHTLAAILLLALMTPLNVQAYDFSYTSINGQTLYYEYNGLASVRVVSPNPGQTGYAIVGNLAIPEAVPHNGTIYTVTAIGDNAFYLCGEITSLVIPRTVVSIGRHAFYNCHGLTSIAVVSGNPRYDSRGNCNALIQTDSNILILGCRNTHLPQSVEAIAECAFYGCNSMTGDLVLSDAVTSIGSQAFAYCSGLTSLSIGNSVTTIGAKAFNNCSGLTSVEIGNSVTVIGDEAFKDCSGLQSILFPNSVTTIGNDAFSGCSGLTSVVLPSSLTTLGAYAFYYCTSLTSVTFGDSLSYIGWGAFSSCSSLSSISLPASITTIGMQAFWECVGLVDIYCHAMVPPVMEQKVFYNDPSIVTLHVPCESESAYREAVGWSQYNNLQCFRMSNAASVSVLSSDSLKGIVVGSANCILGDTMEVVAIAKKGYAFGGWSNGLDDNPYRVVVNSDTVLMAIFYMPDITVHYVHDTTVMHDTTLVHDTTMVHDTTLVQVTNYVHDTILLHDTTIVTDTLRITLHDTIYIHDTITVGVNEVDAIDAKVFVSNGQIVVEGAEGNIVNLYSIHGRLLATKQDMVSAMRFDVPATGAYLVRIGDHPARKVVVTR